jgi:hypothetical protein
VTETSRIILAAAAAVVVKEVFSFIVSTTKRYVISSAKKVVPIIKFRFVPWANKNAMLLDGLMGFVVGSYMVKCGWEIAAREPPARG